MSKRDGGTDETINKWIDRGDGQGVGPDYVPFLKVRDVPSTGRSRKIKCLTTGRIMHYLSDLEYYHHLIEEFNPDVIDIREQFALLPRDETQEIANKIGVKHPKYPKYQTGIVMTSDLVVTEKNGSEISTRVISVKPSSAVDLKNPKSKRVYEKLLIEKIYWSRRGVSWSVSTEKDLCVNMARNLDLLRSSMQATELDFLNQKIDDFISFFNEFWADSATLNSILFQISDAINLSVGNCFCLFARSVWTGKLQIDLETELILHNYPVRRIKDIEG